ncbi:MAG: haloalkane dehalogenase [Rhizobiaceae bacterium]
MPQIPSLTTPDEYFLNLSDWPYEPNYIDDLPGYEGLRVHYVDEGAQDADHVYLCLHGQPTWSYLYRKMIPEFVDSGARVIAPDWLGFGRSDKPINDAVYGFHFHRNMMLALIERLNLTNITLVVQDWGGLLGLTLPPDMPERFERLLIMNTVLAMGKAPSQAFLDWRAYVAANPDMNVGRLMKRATPILNEAEQQAYNAPFPDMTFKAGMRRFPEMVMVEPGMEGIETSKRAAEFWRNEWQGQSFMAVGAQDPVLGPPVMEKMRKIINGCPEPMVIEDAGHFVQEWGKQIASQAIAAFAGKS